MKPAQGLQVVFVVLAAFAVYYFVRTARDGERRRACTPMCQLHPHYAAQNRLDPDFELPTIDGKRVRLSSQRGKVVILNFWTKTCAPCLEEMPSLGQLAKIIEGRKDIVLLTVLTDEGPADVRDSLRSVLGADPPFIAMVDADSAVVAGKYGTKLFPETWFIDPNGVIRARFDGAKDWSSPMTLDFAATLTQPLSCSVEFIRGTPSGPFAGVCEEIAPSS